MRPTTRVALATTILLAPLLALTQPLQAQGPTAATFRPLYRYHSADLEDFLISGFFWEAQCGLDTYAYEGILGYLEKTQLTGTVPLARSFNGEIGSHYYSTDGTAPPGYSGGGALGFVYASQRPGTVPLVRAFHPKTVTYILSTVASEYLNFPPGSFGSPTTLGFVYPAPGPGGQACVPTCTFAKPASASNLQLDELSQTAKTVELEAPVPGSLADWTIGASYTTREGRGPFTDQRTANTILGTPRSTQFAGVGGKVTFGIQTDDCAAAVTVAISGAQPDAVEVRAYLASLYSGPTPDLFWGLALVESSRRHFNRITIPAMSPDPLLWPHESGDEAPTPDGSHIGLLQVPITMRNAFDWRENARAGVALFMQGSQSKLAAAIRNEDRSQREHKGLPDMTPFQREQQAVMLYGTHATGERDRQYWVPACDGVLKDKKNKDQCKDGSWVWAKNSQAGAKGDGKGYAYVEAVYANVPK